MGISTNLEPSKFKISDLVYVIKKYYIRGIIWLPVMDNYLYNEITNNQPYKIAYVNLDYYDGYKYNIDGQWFNEESLSKEKPQSEKQQEIHFSYSYRSEPENKLPTLSEVNNNLIKKQNEEIRVLKDKVRHLDQKVSDLEDIVNKIYYNQ